MTTFTPDFSKSLVYSVTLLSHPDIPAFIELSPYSPEELKPLLKKVVSGYRRDRRDMEIVRGNTEVFASLFDEHFVRIVNGTGTPEEQRVFLSSGGDIGKSSVIESTFAGIELHNAPTAEKGQFDIFTAATPKVDTAQTLCDPATEDEVRVIISHFYQKPTEKQHRAYRSARNSKLMTRKNMFTVTEDYDALEKCYDDTVRSISGAVVDGKPCDEETRESWLPFVPLWHKLLVVDRIYAGLAEKNA